MDTVFPPSPQWHQSHSACLCCISETEGWLLYSLNNSIHILNPFTLKHQGVMMNGHTARINSIASRPLKNFETVAQRTIPSNDENFERDSFGTIPLPISHENDLSQCTPSVKQTEDTEARKILLASAGDDLKVVCWDITTQRVIATLKKAHQKAIKAVEWTNDGRYIVSGDKGGVVIVWSPFSGQTNKKLLPEKPSISCISASPVHADTLAIGLEGGDILIIQANLTYIVILRRLHGHAGIIHNLSWKQTSGDQDQSYTSLASGSADQTIRVWDVEKEASDYVIKVPEADKTLAPHQRSNSWVPVAWTSKGHDIVSFTGRGTMVRWSLDRDAGKLTKVTKGKVHNRTVFQIMMWPLGDFAFSISMDRKIITWDMESGQGVAQIECIGGNAYALDIGPLDPGKIIMGLGDDSIKVWNTMSQDEPYESVAIERLQSKVRSVKWHPVEESKVCFGLENGKIGMIEDILGAVENQPQKQGKKGKQGSIAKNKVSQRQTIFQSYHEGAIVSMTWCTPKVFEAPVPELFDMSLRDSTFCIVSCGLDGRILVTDSAKPTGKSLDLDVVLQRQNSAWYQSYRAIKGIENPGRRDFAIHPREELIAIGNDDGSVEVYELKYFKLVYVYQGHHKRVNRVKWNWSGVTTNVESEGNRVAQYLLASGSDDGSIAIHRLERFSAKSLADKRQRERLADAEKYQAAILTKNEGPTSTPLSATGDFNTVLPTRRVFAYFSYHTRGISDLAWSPHDCSGGLSSANHQKLVSVSYDGKAIVHELRLEDFQEGVGSTNQITTSSNCDEQGPILQSLESTPADQLSSRQHKVLACANPHEGQVLSVHWSLSDVDQIYSGGNDWRVCCWDWKSHRITDVQFEKLKRDNSGTGLLNTTKTTASRIQPKSAKITPQAPSVSDIDNTGNQRLESATTSQTEVIKEAQHIFNRGSSEQQLCTQVLQTTLIAAEISSSTKRGNETISTTDIVTPKRARTSRANVNNTIIQSSVSSASSTSTKYVNLFPLSSAAFRFQSKEKAHLEILRLTRNLYCRRLGQGGILMSDEEHTAARERWRAMREFFEKNGDDEGKRISAILGSDVDEMNFDDSEEEEDFRSCDKSTKSTLNLLQGQDIRENEALNQEKSTLFSSSNLDNSMDDPAAASGDLIFYGSRESVKALAEMEAQEIVKTHSGSNHTQHNSNVFAVGSGLGVLPVSTYRHRGSTKDVKSKQLAQLGQIPVNYWLGDVPNMVDILSSFSDTELGIQDWIGIALSPMGGVAAWKEMMFKTAVKFEQKGEVHAASLCYLGIGRVFEAVDVYRKQELYREALMLLRIRLWDGDDDDDDDDDITLEGAAGNDQESHGASGVINQESKERQCSVSATKSLTDLRIQILTEWGQQLERRSYFEQACKCQLTLAALLRRKMQRSSSVSSLSEKPDIVQAIPSVGLQTLARRGDIDTLRTVAGLAILLKDPSQQERILRYENALAYQKKLEQASLTQSVTSE
ncbi:Gem-associated protein 5 [Entomortierella lignicola]|nr:Gem-associated protein 5 [Entomortierella lignicola]